MDMEKEETQIGALDLSTGTNARSDHEEKASDKSLVEQVGNFDRTADSEIRKRLEKHKEYDASNSTSPATRFETSPSQAFASNCPQHDASFRVVA